MQESVFRNLQRLLYSFAGKLVDPQIVTAFRLVYAKSSRHTLRTIARFSPSRNNHSLHYSAYSGEMRLSHEILPH